MWIRLWSSPSNTREIDKTVVDAAGYHSMCSCKKGGDKNRGHNKVRNLIARAARSARQALEKGIQGIGKQREADVLIGGGHKDGRDQVVDVAITFGGQPSHLTNKRQIQAPEVAVTLIADDYAERAKIKPRQKLISADDSKAYVAVVATHLGCWNTQGYKFLKALGRQIFERRGDGEKVDVYTPALVQQLSCMIQRENYAMVESRYVKSAADFHGLEFSDSTQGLWSA